MLSELPMVWPEGEIVPFGIAQRVAIGRTTGHEIAYMQNDGPGRSTARQLMDPAFAFICDRIGIK